MTFSLSLTRLRRHHISRYRKPKSSSQLTRYVRSFLTSLELIAPKELSDQELLTMHAKVLALQEKLEISYKDASHRLYTAEVEKLALADANHKALTNLDTHISNYLEEMTERFGNQPGSPPADPNAE